jgi:hypothetical protein
MDALAGVTLTATSPGMTFKLALLPTVKNVAEIVVDPAATPVATPAEFTVAMDVCADFQVA